MRANPMHRPTNKFERFINAQRYERLRQEILAQQQSQQDKPRQARKRKSGASDGPLLFSEQQMEKAKVFYRRKLDKTAQAKPPFLKNEDDPKFWHNQEKASRHIAVHFLKLRGESWQTVKGWVVHPVRLEWKAAQQQPVVRRKK